MTQKKTLQLSTYSVESEALASDSKQQELFQQLPSVSKTVSAKPSCESTGPKSQSLTTSEPYRQIDLEELTSVSVDSLASPGVRQETREAQKMTEISGRKCCELLKLYKLNGSLERMCVGLLTSRWASDAVYLTWKASGIKPSHLLFQLAVSTPHIEETAVGSLATKKMWATPRTTDGTGGPRKLDEKGRRISQTNPDLVFGANLSDQVRMWATPNTMDHLPQRSDKALIKQATTTRKGRTRPSNLREQVNPRTVSLWPTARASEYKDPEQPTGQLNSAWVSRLMGYPDGWLEIGSEAFQELRKAKKAGQ